MHIFITGGTRGIGHGMVKELLDLGHSISFTGTRESSFEAHRNDITGDYIELVCDVRVKKQLEESLQKAVSRFGNIDIFINNAGVDQDRLSVSELSEEEIKRVIDINVTGMILGTSVALEQMKKQGYGLVYNMEGLGSNNMAIPKTIIYGSSKRLLTYFSKACNKELKEYKDIYVGRIQPGMVFTDLLMRNLGDDGMKVARIIGNNVKDVTTFIAKRVDKKKKYIKFPSFKRALPRLITAPFKKREI